PVRSYPSWSTRHTVRRIWTTGTRSASQHGTASPLPLTPVGDLSWVIHSGAEGATPEGAGRYANQCRAFDGSDPPGVGRQQGSDRGGDSAVGRAGPGHRDDHQ